MKPMLSSSFRQKVHMIDSGDLRLFLNLAYKHYLPDDIPGGTVHTEQLVHDYIAFHLAVEKAISVSTD